MRAARAGSCASGPATARAGRAARCNAALPLWLVCAAACAPQAGPVPQAAPASAVRDYGDDWHAANAAGNATVRVLYVPAPGFAYRDAAGRLTGVTVEIMREFGRWVAAEHGVATALDFVEEEDWRSFYERVRAARGGVFGLGNVTITDERRRQLRFSPPYLTNVAVLISHESVPALRALEEVGTAFSGLAALAYEGTLHEARLRELVQTYLPGTDILLARSNAEILDGVAAGGRFAYIDAYNYWRARDEGAPIRRHAVADDPAEEFGIIMPLGSDWEPLFARFFERDGGYRETDAYRSLLVEHLGEPLTRALEAARRAGAVAAVPAPQDAFWDHLHQHCGRAYAGRLVVARPERMPLTGEERMVVHFRACGADTLLAPFHIERPATNDWDRSRTWMFMRSADGLELRHDHRHEDGTPHDDNLYGGHTQERGTPNRQEFIFTERVAADGSRLGWRVVIHPGERYIYGTISGGEWTWRVDFDLTRTIEPPPPPWGHAP